MTEQTCYRFILAPMSPGAGGGWVAQVPELPGCIEHGDTPETALAAAKDAITDWIDYAKAEGIPIPEPLPPYGEFSGKFTLRLPRSLHGRLSGLADVEGISLNQYILDRLSGSTKHEMAATVKIETAPPQVDIMRLWGPAITTGRQVNEIVRRRVQFQDTENADSLLDPVNSK